MQEPKYNWIEGGNAIALVLRIFRSGETLRIFRMLPKIAEMVRKLDPALRQVDPSESVVGIDLRLQKAVGCFFSALVRSRHAHH